MNLFSPNRWRAIALTLVVIGALVFALSGYLSATLRVVIDPLVGVQSWFSSRFLAVYEFVTVPRDIASLQQRNSELENEVAYLQTQLIDLQQQLGEAQVLYALLDFARAQPDNQYVAASVIGKDPSPFLHYILIDHGSEDGILHGMPVVTEQGLVGRIDAVTAGAARIQLITDPAFSVNVRLQNSQTGAILQGSITGDISIEMVEQEANLETGDLVLTSGLGGGYPADIIIGQILTVRKEETDLFQSASVQPTVDLANLQAVLIIVNFTPVDTTPLIPTSAP